MKRRLLQFLPSLISLALVVGLFVQVRAYAAEEDSAEFHATVRGAVERIPMQVGEWSGGDVRLPAAAGKLLKPNALFCRHYRHAGTGRTVTVLLVHCRDSRDMTGHYPPVCYPGHGWTMTSGAQYETITLWGEDTTFAVYGFSRTEVNRFVQCVIYDVFVLPRAGLRTEMSDVVSASADYRVRPYGAAQVQVILDAGMPEEERREALRELLEPLAPVVEAMQLKDGGTKT
ncbi:MAG: exosortase-associated EpsI family protein [Phycisphaerales bacterium]